MTAQEAAEQQKPEALEIVVDVEGAVKAPGLYTLPSGARVGDAIDAAGGFSSKASRTSVNLALKLEDGQQVVVATAQEGQRGAGQSEASAQGAGGSESSQESGLISLNSASAQELQALEGIGQALSQRIVDYRQSKGGFSSIEELKEVSGIGEAKFEAIKDRLTL